MTEWALETSIEITKAAFRGNAANLHNQNMTIEQAIDLGNCVGAFIASLAADLDSLRTETEQ